VKVSPIPVRLTIFMFSLRLTGYNPTCNLHHTTHTGKKSVLRQFFLYGAMSILLSAVMPHLCAGQGKVGSNSLVKSKAVSNSPKTINIPPRSAPAAMATFVNADASTQGNWGGRYGAEGYNVIGDVKSYPAYAQVSRNSLAAWTWQPGTDDTRALQKISAAGRIASTWYEDDLLGFAIKITDGRQHRISIYLLDWDYRGRVQQVEILNADNNAVLDSRTIRDFAGGQYLTWNISGSVIIRLKRLADANTICSGLFFDAATAPLARTKPPARNKPPVISSVATAGITSSGATITWTTDKAADSGVEYGPTNNYGNATTIGSPLTTSHQINLIGLAPGTAYHYRILSKDAAGNLARSGDFTFTTAAAQAAPPAAGPGDPEMPRVLLNTTFPATNGRTLSVNAGDNLQAALNDAAPGDTIVLQAGATFTAPSGGFVLPFKSNANNQWIVIRSSNLSALPAGGRVHSSQASAMAKIVSADVSPAILTAAGANYWWLSGLEITITDASLAIASTPGATTNYGLVRLGSDAESDANNLASDVVIDRCYIHGQPTKNVRRGVALNSRRTAIVDSYFADFHEIGSDSQAIAGWNGPGPFKIVNNYLEGAGENIMFGGADPAIPNLVPSDIEFRRNHLAKPRSWLPADSSFAGFAWSVKNIFELKNARRVLVDGNVLENNWVSGQNGFAILFTVRNQDGGSPWSTVEDVIFTNNVLRHTSSAINILGRDYTYPSGQARRLKIKNNVFEDISDTPWGGAGRFLQVTDTVDVKVENNTIFHTGNLIMGYTNLSTPSNTSFVYRNNISAHNSYGVIGDGTVRGMETLNTYFPGAVFVGNILAGGLADVYPAGNYFPATLDGVVFVNRWGGDYRLAASSPFKNGGSDGKDPGVDLNALNAATSGVAP
jgi:hypothetical protein